MEVLSTVVTGVAVFVGGQFIVKSFIEPSIELSKIRGEIAHSLIFYANVYTHPGIPELETTELDELRKEYVSRQAKVLKEVEVTLRAQASELMSRRYAIPCYGLWEVIRFVRKRSDILAAHKALILISGNMFNSGRETADENKQARKEIEKSLGFEEE